MSTCVSSRRRFLSGGSGLAVAALSAQPAPSRNAPPSKTRLILLGTAGGPCPTMSRVPSSQVVIVNDAAYVFDCGIGVSIQLTRAGVPLRSLRHVFITHHHSDHNAAYGSLLLTAWGCGLGNRVDTWGPPPLVRVTQLFLEMNEYDIRIRTEDEGKVPLAPLLHPHEFSRGGLVMREENVTVSCALVDHPPVRPAFAYRLDSPHRSIVISGDTKRSDALIKLAQGADVLVHEVMMPMAINRLLSRSRLYNAARLEKSILSHHTAPEEAGRVAAEARVKALVLSHFVPAQDPQIQDEDWIRGVRRGGYEGRVIVGRDLLEI